MVHWSLQQGSDPRLVFPYFSREGCSPLPPPKKKKHTRRSDSRRILTTCTCIRVLSFILTRYFLHIFQWNFVRNYTYFLQYLKDIFALHRLQCQIRFKIKCYRTMIKRKWKFPSWNIFVLAWLKILVNLFWS